jgi:hypothetical protein
MTTSAITTGQATLCELFAAGLAGLGIQRGETVACWLPNRPAFHVDAGDELTSTIKLKRKPIAKKSANEIESLYGGR